MVLQGWDPPMLAMFWVFFKAPTKLVSGRGIYTLFVILGAPREPIGLQNGSHMAPKKGK